jgi:hypothetical protein
MEEVGAGTTARIDAKIWQSHYLINWSWDLNYFSKARVCRKPNEIVMAGHLFGKEVKSSHMCDGLLPRFLSPNKGLS